MRKIAASLHYQLSLAGILVLWITPGHRYEWMREMDNTITHLPEDGSGNTRIAMAVLALVLVIMQTVRFKPTQGRLEKSVAVALALCAAVLWAMIHR